MVGYASTDGSSSLTSGVIDIVGIDRRFSSQEETEIHALHDINLKIKGGEFITLIGPSGCGKSTLLRLIAGLDQPDSGHISLDGDVIKGPSYLRGLVFQDPTLFPWLTVQKNISVGLVARKILKGNEGEVDALISMIGLEGFKNAFPHQLSGGMAQRVALARALINKPRVLLLDEPLGALDAFTRMHMQDEILSIWKSRRTTMIMVTHDVDEAIYLSDRVVVMSPRPGKIQEIIDIPMGRPRPRNHPDFFRLRSRILETLHFAESDYTDLTYNL